jgi:hypothetical protein
MNFKNLASNQCWIIFILIIFLGVLSGSFVYGSTPEISSIEPNLGRPDQETNIVIKGNNFESGVKVALYGGGPFIKGSASTPYSANNVFISGNFAYVAISTGLQVFDISNPENPTLVAYCSLPNVAKDVFVSGNYAYIATSTAGLQVVDIGSVISNPSEILELAVTGSLDTPWNAEGIYVAGKYAYIADADTVRILDISDPTSPVNVGAYNTPGRTAHGIFVAGNYAYVATGSSGLQILDISDPANVFLKGLYATEDARRLVVKGNYAYVADYDGGLQIIDVSKPESPILSGSCSKISYAYDVYINDDYAYVAGSGPGFSVVDITNPANPVVINSVDTITGYGIHFSGKSAYMTTGTGILIIDVTISDNPSIIGVYDALELANAVAVSGSYAYAASSVSGFHVINISDPANPSFVGACSISDAVVHNIYVAGNYAYVADGVNGLHIINITNPASPYIADTLDTLGTAYDVYVVGNYAYVADDSEGLHVVDISNSSEPKIVGSVKSQQPSNSFRSVHVAGNYAYVLDYWAGILYKIAIVLPANPNITDFCILTTYGNDLYVAGNYAYVAAGVGGLEVIDLTGTLSIVGTTDTPGIAQSVEVAGNYAYVATNSGGIQVVDVSAPSSPLLVGVCDTSGYASDVKVTDSNVFVADGVMGIQIIEPFSPCTNVNLIDPETISAVVPAGYPTGGYNMHIVNPGGEMDILNNGYLISFTPPNQPKRPSFAGPLLLLLFGD